MCRVIVVLLALLMGLGVLFGSQALVVDLGYGMGQHGAMQNAADAGALAAGRLMAGSVSLDASNRPVYALSDNQVFERAAAFAGPNFTGQWVVLARNPTAADATGRLLGTHWLNTLTGDEFELTRTSPSSPPAWTPPAATHQIAVQYLPCPGQADGTPNFSASSNAGLVAEIASQAGIVGTRQTAARADNPGIGSAPDWSWSNPICMLRVWMRESHPPLLASAIGRTADERALAQATVRIAPTTPPSVFSDVWPITHYDDPNNPDPACAFEMNGCALPFWDSHGVGNFKMLVDMSRYSGLTTPNRDQLFCSGLPGVPVPGLTSPCYDTTWPGSNDKRVDPPHWLANGWRGQLYLPNELDSRCTDPARVVQECPNSRFEVFGGDLGSDMAEGMRAYLAAHTDGIDPRCTCPSGTVTVFFWRFGEQNINQTTNRGTVWNGGNGNSIQRVIAQKVRRFRFNNSTIQSSSISGYFVGFYTNSPPQDGPPNNVANTVALVG
jgi:hypothetical protein